MKWRISSIVTTPCQLAARHFRFADDKARNCSANSVATFGLWNVWCEALGLDAIFRSVADRTGSDFLQRMVEKGNRCGANLTQVGRVLSALGFRGCSGPRDVCEGSVLHAGCQQCNVVGTAAYRAEGLECGAIGC